MKIVAGLIILFFTTGAFGHGEDKPGPNGGYIQMPGTFHTEVVPEKDGSFKIFLLNLQNQDPTIKDSSVKVSIKNGKKKEVLKCMAMETHFHCAPGAAGKKGTLVILANRQGAVGVEARYKLPLEARKEAPSQGHEGHH